MIIITGASSNHFRCLKNLLFSISLFEPKTRTVVFDLGLNPTESDELRREHWEVRRFAFELYPPYFDIELNCGEYAWKPVIIADVLRETATTVLWLDAGNIIHQSLDRVRSVLETHGLYTPTSSGSILRWTHPGTLDYLQASPKLLTKKSRSASTIGLVAGFAGARELAERWKTCALEVDCIAPKGSNRSNHRQDQAVLSVLVYQLQEKYGYVLVDERLDISTHNDQLSSAQVRELLRASDSEPNLQNHQ